MSSAEAPPCPPAPPLWRWGLGQMALLGAGLLQVLGGGVVHAIWRRRFSWRGFALALAVTVGGQAAVALAVVCRWLHADGLRDLLLWGSLLTVAALGGAAVATLGRRIALWESYAVTLLAAGLWTAILSGNLGQRLPLGGGDGPGYADWAGQMAPGSQYLGPMWDRLLALAAVGSFLVALVGGSLAFLLARAAGGGLRHSAEWFVARRYLSGRREGAVSVTAGVAVLGVVLGVAALITVTAVMSGYQQDIQSKILATNAHLVVQKYGVDFNEHARVLAEARALPEVQAGSPFVFNEALLSGPERSMGVLLKGIDPTSALGVTDIGTQLCGAWADGRCVGAAAPPSALATWLAPVAGLPGLVVGQALFRRLGQPLGARLALTTPIGIAGARGNAPKRLDFRLAGVFCSGMHEFDARLVYLGLGEAQQLLGLGQAVHGVELRIDDPYQVDRVGRAVLSSIGRYPYSVRDWRELNSPIFTALKLQKIVMFLVLTFIVIVASFNIASTLFMTVVEKAKDIGVLKSMGAQDASVMKIFVMQGWLIGLVGTALGVALGLLLSAALARMNIGIAADVYMVESLQVRVRPPEVALTVAASLMIAHLATLYPALKAARQRPVDAMRHE